MADAIEAAGRAIFDAQQQPPRVAWSDLSDESRRWYCSLGAAAIAAYEATLKDAGMAIVPRLADDEMVIRGATQFRGAVTASDLKAAWTRMVGPPPVVTLPHEGTVPRAVT